MDNICQPYNIFAILDSLIVILVARNFRILETSDWGNKLKKYRKYIQFICLINPFLNGWRELSELNESTKELV